MYNCVTGSKTSAATSPGIALPLSLRWFPLQSLYQLYQNLYSVNYVNILLRHVLLEGYLNKHCQLTDYATGATTKSISAQYRATVKTVQRRITKKQRYIMEGSTVALLTVTATLVILLVASFPIAMVCLAKGNKRNLLCIRQKSNVQRDVIATCPVQRELKC